MQYEITDHDREELCRQLDALKTAFTEATIEGTPTDEIRAYDAALDALEATALRMGILTPEPGEDAPWSYQVRFIASHPETGVRTTVLVWGLFDSVAEAQTAAFPVLGNTQDYVWANTPEAIERTDDLPGSGEWSVDSYMIERRRARTVDQDWSITVDLYER